MTAPDLEGIIAAALNEHWRAHVDIAGDDIRYVCECGAVELVEGSGHSSTTTWSRAHQARAVLAAISEAGAVEWGVFRKSDALAAGAFDEAIFKTKAAADAFIKLGFLPHVVERVEPRSRLTFPWTPTVAWGVSYKGRVYPYESEDEARRQLRLAQMDVPAMLVTKVGDGEWVEVEG